MNKQDYIEAFGREIEPIFANTNKIGFGAIRQSIMDEVDNLMQKKKIADAKNKQVHQIRKDRADFMYNTLITEFPEISGFIRRSSPYIIISRGGFDLYISFNIHCKTIDSNLEYDEWVIDSTPYKLSKDSDYRKFSSFEEMVENAWFINAIKEAYKIIARMEASKK